MIKLLNFLKVNKLIIFISMICLVGFLWLQRSCAFQQLKIREAGLQERFNIQNVDYLKIKEDRKIADIESEKKQKIFDKTIVDKDKKIASLEQSKIQLKAERDAAQAANAVMMPTDLVKALGVRIGESEISLMASGFFQFTLIGARNTNGIFINEASYKKDLDLSAAKMTEMQEKMDAKDGKMTEITKQRDDAGIEATACGAAKITLEEQIKNLNKQIGQAQWAGVKKTVTIGAIITVIIKGLQLLKVF